MAKSLIEHQRDIEDIVTRKGGKIIKGEWKMKGQKRPYFWIECNKGHRFEVRKSDLFPRNSSPEGSWCTHPDCRGKSLIEHQRDIEDIVARKGGKIIKGEWQIIGQKRSQTAPSFKIRCDKRHEFSLLKSNLMPSKNNPEGTWCHVCQNRLSAIGTFGHIPIEYFSSIHFNSKGCKVEHEETLEEGTRPDLMQRHFTFKG